MTITRRDFLNGTALIIGGAGTGLLTACQKPAQPSVSPVTASSTASSPIPQLTQTIQKIPLVEGGNKAQSIGVAHQMGWTNKQFDVSGLPHEETYDLVVVGAGISGLASAYFYQQRFPKHRILIIDNNDNFGGHATRNEFSATMDGKPIFRLSYGGSESIDSPKTHYSRQALNLLKALGIDYTKFENFFDQKLYANHGLKKGVLFNQKTFGKTKIINDMPTAKNADTFFANAPLSHSDKTALITLYQHPQDYLAPMPLAKREKYLKSISYDKYLSESVKLPATAKAFLQDICLEYWGFPIDYLSAWDALHEGYAGFDKLGIKTDDEPSEPYIYHFPDGNASIARLLVKKLIPNVVKNPEHGKHLSPMECIVLDEFDDAQLDKPNQAVNIRLNATVVQTVNQKNNQVMVGYRYQNDEQLHRVTAKHVILACYGVMIPHLAQQLDSTRQQDFKQNVKVPLIYGKVLVKNWHAFKKLGVDELYAPTSPFCLVKLDYPVSMGGYECPKNPDEPMIIHMAQVPVRYGAKTLRDACRAGRSWVLSQDYQGIEKQLLEQLREIYEQAGETLDDKILAITINRWGHGYSYENNMLWDTETQTQRVLASIKQPIGNIHIANSDANWQPYANGAIDQAWRAVSEIKR